MTKAAEADVAVYRGGEGDTRTISIDHLLVGDIIQIMAGMSIPADCILVEGTDVACDESAMTGEPD